jgi:hypothetical protein
MAEMPDPGAFTNLATFINYCAGMCKIFFHPGLLLLKISKWLPQILSASNTGWHLNVVDDQYSFFFKDSCEIESSSLFILSNE